MPGRDRRLYQLNPRRSSPSQPLSGIRQRPRLPASAATFTAQLARLALPSPNNHGRTKARTTPARYTRQPTARNNNLRAGLKYPPSTRARFTGKPGFTGPVKPADRVKRAEPRRQKKGRTGRPIRPGEMEAFPPVISGAFPPARADWQAENAPGRKKARTSYKPIRATKPTRKRQEATQEGAHLTHRPEQVKRPVLRPFDAWHAALLRPNSTPGSSRWKARDAAENSTKNPRKSRHDQKNFRPETRTNA